MPLGASGFTFGYLVCPQRTATHETRGAAHKIFVNSSALRRPRWLQGAQGDQKDHPNDQVVAWKPHVARVNRRAAHSGSVLNALFDRVLGIVANAGSPKIVVSPQWQHDFCQIDFGFWVIKSTKKPRQAITDSNQNNSRIVPGGCSEPLRRPLGVPEDVSASPNLFGADFWDHVHILMRFLGP